LEGKNINLIDSPPAFPALMDVVMKNKAKSEIEWIAVYAFYASNFGQQPIGRNTIIEYYEKSKRNSKSNIGNLSANFKSAIGKDYLKFLNDEEFIITPPGIDKAKEIISREPGTMHMGSESSKAAHTKGKSPSTTTSTPKLLGDLNLSPQGKESLKDFYSKYDAKSNFEKNLLFCYYLLKHVEASALNWNHFYTCYKAVAERVPGNLYQSLTDTKNRKGWIDTQNTEDIKLTIAGENYVEHEMPKKQTEHA